MNHRIWGSGHVAPSVSRTIRPSLMYSSQWSISHAAILSGRGAALLGSKPYYQPRDPPPPSRQVSAVTWLLSVWAGRAHSVNTSNQAQVVDPPTHGP